MLAVKIPAPGTKAREKYDERQLNQAVEASRRFIYVVNEISVSAVEAGSVLRHGFCDTDDDGNPMPGTIAERVANATESMTSIEQLVFDAKAKMETALSVLSPEKRAEYDSSWQEIGIRIELAEVQIAAFRDWMLKEIQKHPAN